VGTRRNRREFDRGARLVRAAPPRLSALLCPARRRLEGVLCEDVHEAQAAAADADFLAIKIALAPAELAALCGRVSVPVFARGISPLRAWAQVASGISAIPAKRCSTTGYRL
jgi:hypothetical protein